MIVNAKRAGLFLAAAASLLIGACNPPPDYGSPCRLTRPSLPDGGGIEFVAVNDSALNPAFDFLANGDPECEDLVCIRQHGKDYSALDTDQVAHGECSTPCIGDSDCGDPAKGLTCVQLAFDPAFLSGLQQNDPATYNQYFGDSASANYCTDPNLPDLGQ
jgi:hypothetical protein